MAGEMDEMKGRAKEAMGALTDDDSMKTKGKIDKAGGKLKHAADRVTDRLEDAVDRSPDDRR